MVAAFPATRFRQMNCEHVDLEPIEVERFQVKEVLKALLHSIIFQRALGAQQMRDTDSDLFDLSYVRSDSRAIDAKVEEQTEAFVKALERDETMAGHQVCLSFFELRVRPSTFGLFRSEEKVVWERWTSRCWCTRATTSAARPSARSAASPSRTRSASGSSVC